MKNVLVLAGNHQQFKFYIGEILGEGYSALGRKGATWFEIDDKRYIYVANEISVLGLRATELLRVGTWYDHPDAKKLEALCQEIVSRGQATEEAHQALMEKRGP